MARTGKITLKQGTGKNSGKPFTALKLEAGKWTQLHFPTQFERDYLVEYLKTNEGTISLDEPSQRLILSVGDYQHNYVVDSIFEWNYLVKWFQDESTTSAAISEADSKINLNDEEVTDNGLFDN